ncbi:DUF4355 domain-containing protein, partial [Enterocloster bolteae]
FAPGVMSQSLITSANQPHHNKKIRIGDVIPTLILYELAKMTKEEKAQYLSQKQERALAAREADITRRELMAEAKNTLAEKKLPVGLAEVLNYTNAESCNKSIDAVEKAFQEAVQAAVDEKLKGGPAPKKAPSGGGDDLAKQVESLMMGI